MINAVKLLSFIKLYLAGPIIENDIETEINDYENIIYLGILYITQISNLFEKCKYGLVTLHPTLNYFDSLPIKIFECMSARIPVIVSNFPL